VKVTLKEKIIQAQRAAEDGKFWLDHIHTSDDSRKEIREKLTAADQALECSQLAIKEALEETDS